MKRKVHMAADAEHIKELKAEVKNIRDALEFYERLVIFKTNRHNNLSSVYQPVTRFDRENFADYALRVRQAFPLDHKLPRLRIRKP